jgi:glycine cleavage system H protein
MSKNPENILYSASHEWVRMEGEEAVVGISHFAQESLGDITYVELPEEGDELEENAEFGSVESVKAASDLISPVSGSVVAVNSELEDAPELCNSDPYGAGWLVKVKVDKAPSGLMDAKAYEDFCASNE